MNHVINRFIFNGVKDGSGTRLGLVMRRVFGVFEYEYGQWFVQVSAFRRRVTRRYLWDTTACHSGRSSEPFVLHVPALEREVYS